MKSTVAPIPLSHEVKFKAFLSVHGKTIEKFNKDYAQTLQQIKLLDKFSFVHELDKDPEKKAQLLNEWKILDEKQAVASKLQVKLTPEEEQRLTFLEKLFAQYQRDKVAQESKHTIKSQKLAIDFGKKVINTWFFLQLEARKNGIALETLPRFITQEDLKTISRNISPLFTTFASSDVWLRRLIGERTEDESRRAYKNRIEDFLAREIETSNDKTQLSTAFNRFKKGILKDFNAYSLELNHANEILKSLKEFSDPVGNKFQKAVYEFLSGLEHISISTMKQEEQRFKTTPAYTGIEGIKKQRNALSIHMSHYAEFVPCERKLLFIQKVLESQKTTKFTSFKKHREEEEDTKIFKPLFTNKKFVQKLSELHEALKNVESTRLAYLEAEEKANKPSRKRSKSEDTTHDRGIKRSRSANHRFFPPETPAKPQDGVVVEPQRSFP